MNLKTKSVCVVDFGLFVELAVTLTRWFGKVYYHFYQASPFPMSNGSMVGQGLSGIEVLETRDDFRDKRDEIDLFVFPDTYLADVQEDLLADGKLVWGSRGGDEIELYRIDGKKACRRLGIPIGPYQVVKGIEALREYLKEHDDQYVKCSYWRGDFETFHSPNYRFIESRLQNLAHVLGPKKHRQEFVVEEAIPEAVEIGYDGFCIDGKFPRQSLVGIEIKGKAYLGQMAEFAKLPRQLRGFNEKMGPELKQHAYRNFLSSELRITKEKKAYLLDPCMRCGNPPAAVQLEFYENLGAIIWEGAQGQVVTPESQYLWAAQLQLASDWVDTNELVVQFPEKLRPWVKLINGAKVKGEYYIVPQNYKITSVGAVVAGGRTPEEAIEKCRERAQQVQGYYLESEPQALDAALGEWRKLKEYGIEW